MLLLTSDNCASGVAVVVVAAAVAAAAPVVVIVVVVVAVVPASTLAFPSCKHSFENVGLNFFGTIQHDSTASHKTTDGHSSCVGCGSRPPPNTCVMTAASSGSIKYGRFPSVNSAHAITPNDHTSVFSE